MSKTDKYIGIDYENMNCAELCEYYLKQEYNYQLVLPQMPKTLLGFSKTIDKEIKSYKKTMDPVDGCLVLMKARGIASHLGIYVSLSGTGYVLHAFKAHGESVLTKLSLVKSLSLTIEGFFLWQS